jgi:hypothetical protein
MHDITAGSCTNGITTNTYIFQLTSSRQYHFLSAVYSENLILYVEIGFRTQGHSLLRTCFFLFGARSCKVEIVMITGLFVLHPKGEFTHSR